MKVLAFALLDNLEPSGPWSVGRSGIVWFLLYRTPWIHLVLCSVALSVIQIALESIGSNDSRVWKRLVPAL